jgi:hypothetical protein
MSVTEKLSAEEIAEFREIFSLVDKVSVAIAHYTRLLQRRLQADDTALNATLMCKL